MKPPLLLVALAFTLLCVAVALYGLLTREGRSAWHRLGALAAPPVGRVAAPIVPTPAPGRPGVVYWIARDGLWTAQRHPASAGLTDRIEQLSNLVLDRLGLGLLVVQAMVADDDVVYLYFSVPRWEPTAREEVDLSQSLVRTLLSDLPWLSGVRLVLPEKHLDYSRPLQHFDPGFDPLLAKPRSTLAPASWAERTPDAGPAAADDSGSDRTPPPEEVP
jgi:hypothetical protein